MILHPEMETRYARMLFPRRHGCGIRLTDSSIQRGRLTVSETDESADEEPTRIVIVVDVDEQGPVRASPPLTIKICAMISTSTTLCLARATGTVKEAAESNKADDRDLGLAGVREAWLAAAETLRGLLQYFVSSLSRVVVMQRMAKGDQY